MAAVFADNIYKCIFLTENVWISLNISRKFVLEVRINNIPALVQTTKRQAIIRTNDGLSYWRIYAPLGLDERINYKNRIEFDKNVCNY